MRTYNKQRINGLDREHYICPKMARAKWNMAKRGNRTLYLYGMSGYGKTSLINYLACGKTDIYISAVDIEPEDLEIEESGRIRTVVIDDINRLYKRSDEKELVGKIIQLIWRDDIWLVMAGRCQMPWWLANATILDNMVVIREEELAFTNSSTAEFFGKWDVELTEEEIKKLHSVFKGNGFAMKFIALHLERGNVVNEELFVGVNDEICRYAANNIYEYMDTSTLKLMARLAIVEEFDYETLRVLTGAVDAEGIIEDLQQTGCFVIERYNEVKGYYVYSIRPYARQTLLRYIGKIMSAEEISDMYRKTGQYYEGIGQYVKAMRYYKISGSDEDMASVLVSNAKQNPGSGQYFELRRYYNSLPIDTVRQSPDLIYALSMVNSMTLNIEQSDKWANELKSYIRRNSGEAAKYAKMQLDYLEIALPHRGDKDLLKLFSKVGSNIASGGMHRSDFSITSNMPSQMNGGKDFSNWSKNDTKIAKGFGKVISTVLGRGGRALVNLALAESFFEKGMSEQNILQYINDGRMQAESADMLEQIFVADALLIWMYVIKGNMDEAQRVVDSFIKKSLLADQDKITANATALRIRLDMYNGDRDKVIKWLEDAPDENVEFSTIERFKYLTKIRAYIMLERYDAAKILLLRMLHYASVMKRTYIEAECNLLMAIVKYRTNGENWRDDFDKCIATVREYGFIRIISREGSVAKELLKQIDENDEFLQRIKTETYFVAKRYPSYLINSGNSISIEGNALKILKMQAEGKSVSEISAKLNINSDTVKYHNKQNYKKLGVNNKTSAVVEAKARRII